LEDRTIGRKTHAVQGKDFRVKKNSFDFSKICGRQRLADGDRKAGTAPNGRNS
jgi:hypothetical protein